MPKILLHFSAKRIHKSKRRRRRTGDNAEEPIESDGALEDTSGEEDDEEGNVLIWRFFLFCFLAEDPIPLFLRKAITFIEREGLDAEGLYRVPGNRAHVELLFQKFDDDPKVDIDELDIAVNAVATAVKDFFFKRLPSILDPDHMAELETISCK